MRFESLVLESLNTLWEAYKMLNGSAAKISGSKGDILDVSSEVIKIGKRIYESAHLAYHQENFKQSKNFAQAVCHLCFVLDHMIQEDIDNILSLKLPPALNFPPAQLRAVPRKSIHPSLIELNSILERRTIPTQKKVDSYLRAEIRLLKVSKCLEILDKVH